MLRRPALVVVELCSAAAQRGRQQPPHYGQHYDSNPDYSYSQVEQYDVAVDVADRMCYSCEYTLHVDEGSRDCMDPFTGVGVKQIECDFPCSVSYSSPPPCSY